MGSLSAILHWPLQYSWIGCPYFAGEYGGAGFAVVTSAISRILFFGLGKIPLAVYIVGSRLPRLILSDA